MIPLATKFFEEAARIWEGAASDPRLAAAASRAASHAGLWSNPARWVEMTIAGRPVEVGRTSWRGIWRRGAATLRAYEPAERSAPPVLLVYAMVNRPYVLDMLPGRSVVQAFLSAGFPTYLLDWGDPGPAEAETPLDSFVQDVLGGAVDEVLAREGAARLHLLGYCQGGTLAAEVALARQAALRSLTLLAAPIDFERMGPLAAWSREFDPESVRAPGANVSGRLLGFAFEALRPFGAGLRWAGFLDRLARNEPTREEREHFAAMERWIADPVDHPGRAYVEFVRRYYQGNDLAPRLGALSTPLLAVVGDSDQLVPPGSTLAALEVAGSETKEALHASCGHIGLSVSRKSHAELWPRVAAWMRGRP